MKIPEYTFDISPDRILRIYLNGYLIEQIEGIDYPMTTEEWDEIQQLCEKIIRIRYDLSDSLIK